MPEVKLSPLIVSNEYFTVFIFSQLLKTGDEDVYKLRTDRQMELRIVLVYTDYPGPVTPAWSKTSVLVNDLDLEVSCTDGKCDTKSSTNRVDNVEYVSVQIADNTEISVRVTPNGDYKVDSGR